MPRRRLQKKRRQTKAERALANAERLAKLLIAAPSDGDGMLAPPAFIADPRLAPALQFWREHAPQFAQLGTLERIDRFAFAVLCIFAAEFVAAQDDILANGYSVKVRTVSGDQMPRENPSVARRAFAAKMIMELSRSFGLTKLDRLNLNRLNRGSTYVPGDLFGGDRQPSNELPQLETIDPEVQKLRDLLSPGRMN